jgi:ubiquinone/menaquinone biosynthesis C-methylase UbiE
VGEVMRRISEIWSSFAGRGVYPHELAFLLGNPAREIFFSRRQLLGTLGLSDDSTVLELGPGPGFFSPTVAKAIPHGRLELVDVQLPMLRKARRRVQRAHLGNVSFTCGSGCELPYGDRTFDVAFLVAVLGEVPSPAACIRELARVLQPGGRLSITELAGDPDAVSREQLSSLLLDAGLSQPELLSFRGGYTAVSSVGPPDRTGGR